MRQNAQPISPPASWPVMRVDGRPIRDKARKAYQRAMRELENARRQIQQFETKDRPGYGQWINRQFGSLLADLRETSRKLETTRHLLYEVQTEAIQSHSSFARAYERVMERNAAEKAAADRHAHGNPGGGEDGSGKFFDGENDGDGNHAGPEGADAWTPPPTAPPKNATARLKELYRAVVRRLHPDAQIVTPQRKEWWHQAQKAYQSGDAEQLQVILSLCDIEEHGTTARTSVSLLMRITRQFRSALRTLRTQLTRYRRDPAWNFSTSSDHAPLAEQTERLLTTELLEVKRMLAAMESQLAAWARQAKPQPQSVFRRAVRPEPGCMF